MIGFRVNSLGVFALLLCSAPPGIAHPPSIVPLDAQFGAPPVPIGGEYVDHLLYELRLTNFAARNVTLKSVEVIDSQTGKVLARYEHEALAEMIDTPGIAREGEARRTLAPGGFAIVFFDTKIPRGAAAGLQLSHRLRIEPSRPDQSEDRLLLETRPLAVPSRGPTILGAPLRGSGWLAANALSNANDHRRAIGVFNGQARLAQRFAIDFVQLDHKGRAFVGDRARNDSWTGYGSDVLAAEDGVIEVVHDGVPDNIPFAPPVVPITVETIGGNHVVLRLAGGHRVFYGHLKPGSIRVREGQHVVRGQCLAALGNSGQSDAPHLHFHVADGPSALDADGQAYAFRHFMLEGHVPSSTVVENPTGWQHSNGPRPVPHFNELPVDNAVVSFAR